MPVRIPGQYLYVLLYSTCTCAILVCIYTVHVIISVQYLDVYLYNACNTLLEYTYTIPVHIPLEYTYTRPVWLPVHCLCEYLYNACTVLFFTMLVQYVYVYR